jgi:hypothetical protein
MEAAGPPESMTILLQLQCERKEVHVKQSATIKKKMQYKQNKQGKTRNSNKHTYHFFDGGDVELQHARKDLDSVEPQVRLGEGFADSFAVGHAEYRLITLVTPIGA